MALGERECRGVTGKATAVTGGQTHMGAEGQRGDLPQAAPQAIPGRALG